MLKKLKGYLSKQGDGEVVGIASTEATDRQGEIIKQDGWDLTNFKTNPVILASHNYSDFPIGKATDIAVESGKLMFTMIFSQATDEAKQAYELVKEGVLNCFSVGFIPRAYDENNQDIITRAELLEISLVSVPANPQAVVVAKSMKDNKLAEQLIKEWMLDEKMKKSVESLEKGEEEEKEEIEEKEEKSGRTISNETMTKLKCVHKSISDGIAVLEEMMDCMPEKSIKKDIASEGGDTEEIGEESEKVEQENLDVKLLQKTTGCLQDLLHTLKKGGAKK